MAEVSKARFTYRLRVSKTAERRLNQEWDGCRWVWNKCVEESQRIFEAGEPFSKARISGLLKTWRAENEWLAEGSFRPQQGTIRDFFLARDKALKDRKHKIPFKQRRGMPRFKSKKTAFPTLGYAGSDYRIDGKYLQVAKGIRLRVVWERDLPSPPSSVRVYKDSLGHWYASFVVATTTEPLPATGESVGIDWGVKKVATTTDPEHDFEHPEFGKKSQAKLTRYQRMMSRRRPAKGQPGSRGYQQAKKKVARVHKKVTRQRQDASRKWAKSLARDFDSIAVEDFKPGFMFKNRRLSRKSADAAIGSAKDAVIEMGRKHERKVKLVNPAYSTMDCANCGARAKHRLPLSERVYFCTACGIESDRDSNAAAVVRNRASFNPEGADRVIPAESSDSGVP